MLDTEIMLKKPDYPLLCLHQAKKKKALVGAQLRGSRHSVKGLKAFHLRASASAEVRRVAESRVLAEQLLSSAPAVCELHSSLG